jgi:3-methyladenine DNA glycosylase AlkC
MAEPLKNRYNEKMIKALGEEIIAVYPEFNKKEFQKCIFADGWDKKELKDRMYFIAKVLHDYIPEKYSKSINILKKVSTCFEGFEYMIFPAFVELYGLEYYEESIVALEYFTPRASSEFAVRPFIIKYETQMMNQMSEWAESCNPHVRRLASEGCRPRLPWAMALPNFKENPTPVLSILKKLLMDESEYVRRSVANNLNDISKDNPKILISLAKKCLGGDNDTDKLIKHACRSLLKKGDSEALNLFGFNPATHIIIEKFKVQTSVNMGSELTFSFTLKTARGNLGKLRIEYAIDFMKKNGQQRRKVFKISESDYIKQTKTVLKQYSFKQISTRTYYVGKHHLAILLNGKEMEKNEFILCDKY